MVRFIISFVRWLFEGAMRLVGPAPQHLHHVEDYTFPTFTLRVYTPLAAASPSLPVCLFFHGGGWIVGSVKAYDPLCQYIAARTPCVVVSVDYRLAPEHPFPAAVEDVLAAYHWVRDHLLPRQKRTPKLILAGDSAGGNLAAIVTHQIMQQSPDGSLKPTAQILLYPLLSIEKDQVLPQIRWYYPIFRAFLRLCVKNYLPTTHFPPNHPQISPLVACAIPNLPPTYVMSVGMDILTEDAQKYVNCLRHQHIPVTYQHYEDLWHGCLQFTRMSPKAQQALEDMMAFIRSC